MAASEIFRRINPLSRGEITRHGRRELGTDVGRSLRLVGRRRKRTHRTAETPDVVLSAIERAEMDPKHAPLDELLK